MNRKLLHSQIENSLETLREQHGELKKQDRVYPIELDIMLAEIRKLYDNCRQLEKMNIYQEAMAEKPAAQPAPSPAKEAGEKPLKLTPPAQAPEIHSEPSIFFSTTKDKTGDAGAGKIEQQAAPAEPEPFKNSYKEPVINLTSDEGEVPVITASQLEIPMNAEDKTLDIAKGTGENRVQTKPVLADKFREEPSLYDKISKGKEDSSLVTKMQKKPIPDLKAAIGINEKFSFINNLFGGDALEYTNTVDYVNKCGDLRNAIEFLNENAVKKFGWQQDNSQVHEFFELVERRFM